MTTTIFGGQEATEKISAWSTVGEWNGPAKQWPILFTDSLNLLGKCYATEHINE